MAFRISLVKRNSAYKVFQNPLKGNSFSDVVAFKTLEERDKWMDGFLGYDWKKELEKKEAHKTITWQDEIHFKVVLDLTKDTLFGLDRQVAQQCDLVIMEDTNQPEDSPFRFTFWSAHAELEPNQIYTTLEFQCEEDMFMTIPFDHMFKDDVQIRLDRGETTDKMGYASELSFGENFQFNIDNYVPVYKGSKKYVRHVFGNKKNDTTLDDCAVIVSLNSSQAQSQGELLNYFYQFPVYYSLETANTITQHVLKLDNLKNSIEGDNAGLIVPDITYLVFRNKLAIPTEIRRSEYLISLQQLPISYEKITASNPNEKIYLDNKQITAIDISLDAELKKWLSFDLDLLKIDESGKITSETIGDMLREQNDSSLDPHSKMLHSAFNKAVLAYGQLKFEVKSENWSFNEDSSTMNGRLIFTPQAVNVYADLNNAPYYNISFVWNYRAINIAGDFKLPTIVSGDQATLQQFNTANLTNDINKRDRNFQYANGALEMASGASDAVTGGIEAFFSMGLLGRGNIMNGAKEITNGIHMEMSASDNINRQAAQLADSKNNIGTFNDGSKDGIEAYDSNGIEIYKYTLQEPLRSMVVSYLRTYGYNLGGNLYDVKSHTHARAKHDYLRASQDIGIIYQALREEISPAQAKIIALTILQGVRLWWADKFTYIGDYAAENNIIDPDTGKEIPNTDIQ